MKHQREKILPVSSNSGVDFLSVPPENVVNLRKPPPPSDLPERSSRGRSRNSEEHGVGRQIVSFVLIALLLIAPIVGISLWQRTVSLRGKVLGVSTDALQALSHAAQAMQSLDAQLAKHEFSQAASGFREARRDLDRFRVVVEGMADVLPAAAQAKSGKELLRVGEEVAQAGLAIAELSAQLLEPPEKRTTDFPHLVSQVAENLDPALASLERATEALEDVQPQDLPDPYREPVEGLMNVLPDLRHSLSKVKNASGFLAEFLGLSRTQRYLVLFQNNLELRATGGFIGSLALVDVTEGNITKLDVPTGGAYDLKGQLSEKIIAPQPLHIVNPHWQLQDANWWPDFPASSEKIRWFYEKSGRPTVDGVIAVTPDLLVDLLNVTGPIDLTATYGRTITAENFLKEVLLVVKEHSEEPKQIIADILPVVLDRLFLNPSVDPLSLIAIFERAVAEKHLLMYFPDPDRQSKVVTLGWAGELTQTPRDYLSVIDTNIGGGKTDGVIDVVIEHQASIQDDGSIIDKVTVTRTHHGVLNDPFTGLRNVDYLRFYVPQGSELLDVEGFERIDPKRFQAPDPGYHEDETLLTIEGHPIIDGRSGTKIGDEFGKTVFANWLGVGPGETARAQLTYKLPFRLDVRRTLFQSTDDTYSLFVQKQPGTSGRFLQSTVHYPESYELTWAPPEVAHDPDNRFVMFSSDLNVDRFFGAVFSPKR